MKWSLLCEYNASRPGFATRHDTPCYPPHRNDPS